MDLVNPHLSHTHAHARTHAHTAFNQDKQLGEESHWQIHMSRLVCSYDHSIIRYIFFNSFKKNLAVGTVGKRKRNEATFYLFSYHELQSKCVEREGMEI